MLVSGQNLRYIPPQPIIEKAVSNGLFVCRQSYQILDLKTGDLYGLNGQEEFGTQYTLGIKACDGFLTYDKFMHPWDYDDKFNKYRGKYTPVIYNSSFAEQNETATFDSLNCDKGYKAMCDSSLCQVPSKTFGRKGFVLDNTSGEKEGWIVLVTYSTGQSLEQNTSLNYLIYNETFTVKDSKSLLKANLPNTATNILGGIFVTPIYTGIGKVEFKLCGVLVQAANKEWRLCCPFIDMQTDDTENMGPSVTEDSTNKDEPELTPVKKNSDNNKKKRKKK